MEEERRAIDTLREEHRVIERVLAALERAAERLEEGGELRPEFFDETVDFLRHFADGCHHRKEERLLFDALVEYGMSRDAGPVGVMLFEHEQGRAHVHALETAVARWREGELQDPAEVATAARAYAGLLRQHIAKENGVLFPMAERLLPAEERTRLAAEFDRVEREETGEGEHARFHALAERLAAEMSR